MPEIRDMIKSLESHGLTRAEIAAETKISKATIWRMANPSYSGNVDHLSGTIRRVESLHERVVGGATRGVASPSSSMFHGKPGGR